jgi:Flp pilus assembly protein TadD
VSKKKRRKGRGSANGAAGPPSIEAIIGSAWRLLREGSFTQARGLAEGALKLVSGHAEALHILGLAALQTGRTEKAVDLIGQAIAADDSDPSCHSNLAVALNRLGRGEEAEAASRRAVKLRADYADGHVNLGLSLENQGRLEDAEAAFRRAIEARPGHVNAHNNLGNVLRRRGELDAAISAYHKAVALLGHPDFSPQRMASLEMIMSVGAPLHLEHKQALTSALPGRFHELYGLTEGMVTILDKNDADRKMGSVGVPPPFSEIKILDRQGEEAAAGEVGEICGRGPFLMPGYYNRPALTKKAVVDGWLHSGDLGYVDEDGFLFLVDRKKDMIISGGVNVYPRDIEEIVVQHPAVRETAVFGVPHDKWGETPIAAVIVHETGAADAINVTNAEELKEWINAHVGAKFQRVHKVIVVEDFPRSVAGKTLKRFMRDDYLSGAG